MGLTLAVGLFAQNLAEDEEDAEALSEPFRHLDEVLAEAGFVTHSEPTSLPHEEYFEAQMWGYGGLHALRRLAAYVAIEGRLPEPVEYGAWTDDPVYQDFCKAHERYAQNPLSRGFLGMFRKKIVPPPFQHLVMHSDAEGFYVPQEFADVIVDWSQPERPGLGMMVGSSHRLLEECQTLAKWLQLPSNFDPEADEFLELVGEMRADGEPWQILSVEAHSAANLIAAARASVRTGAAIQFA
jgi:hypothetical protein